MKLRHAPSIQAALLLACLLFSSITPAQTTKVSTAMTAPASTTSPLATAPGGAADFQVFEFRRYTIKPGKREDFATYFEAYFPQAFQQIGMLAFGEGFERGYDNGFTWLRGFRSMDARAMANATFYYGPVWREHRNTLNELIDDSDNVYLMRPLTPQRAPLMLPAVDPVLERQGAQGILVAQLLLVQPGKLDAAAERMEDSFARYRAAGMREAGVLMTLDAVNNFPQLPVRKDGPYLLWLGLAKDSQMADEVWAPLARQAQESLAAEGLLAGKPEQIIIKPAPQSRLRWVAQ
jgi:hypothetical protein